MAHWWLVPIGLVVGMFGTMIGAGGGFLLVPILLLAFPEVPPDLVTSISLAVVFVNASAGTVSYARLKRIDYRSGLMFAAATVPGAIIGAYATSYIPRRAFDVVFGVLLTLGSAYLVWNPLPAPGDEEADDTTRRSGLARRLVERDGTIHTWRYPPAVGVAISAVVGFASSLLGIGGGIIHVPVLAQLLDFPVHVATATSHFTLAIMALAGTLVHIFNGTLRGGLETTGLLALGVLVGAPLGAELSGRVHGTVIMRGLAIALGLVGIRVLIAAF